MSIRFVSDVRRTPTRLEQSEHSKRIGQSGLSGRGEGVEVGVIHGGRPLVTADEAEIWAGSGTGPKPTREVSHPSLLQSNLDLIRYKVSIGLAAENHQAMGTGP